MDYNANLSPGKAIPPRLIPRQSNSTVAEGEFNRTSGRADASTTITGARAQPEPLGRD